MDLSIITGNKSTIWGTVISIVMAIYGWYKENQTKITAIVLRIEKDAEDGWTNEEKEQLAIDLFFQEVYPTLNPTFKLIPKFFYEKILRSMIRGICSKAKIFKKKIEETKK